jgi:peptidoglycan/LPS O-acetylase OafA/YrhL
MTNKNYDLEFLRGLSVLLVFFFHFNTNLFNSFFVGVDIFFLVSGYVITGSVLQKDKFNLSSFYLRRFKRIYPNLLFILFIFAVIFFTFYDFLPHEFDQNFFSIIFSIFGISNIFYTINPNLFYFTDEIRWLIHTWSLSVEIQYYFLVGLIFYIYFKLFRLNLNFKIYFKIFIISLFIISFLIFLLPEKKFVSDYYSLPARLWEFSLGSIAYLFPFKKKLNFNYLLIAFVSIISFASYLSLNFKFDILIAIFFSYIMVVFSKNNNENIFTIFFRFFGKISYSFYLWHLITISFFINITEFYIFNFVIIFLLTLILSIFTFNFIEIKFNRKFNYDYYLKKSISILLISVSIFFIYSLTINQKLFIESFNSLNKFAINFFHIVDNVNSGANKYDSIFVKKFDHCENYQESFKWRTGVNCLRENSNSKLVYIMGNSYADHIVPVTSKAFLDSDLYLARFDNCYLAKFSKCDIDKKNQIFYQYSKISKKYDEKIVIISLSGNNYSKKKISQILNRLETLNTLVVFVYPHPSVNDYKNEKEINKYYSIKKNDFKILKDFERLILLDTFENICLDCDLDSYSQVFIDGHHFSLNGSLSLIELFRRVNF